MLQFCDTAATFIFQQVQKIENCNQFSIFAFRPKHPKSFALEMTKGP